ncbi:hypothetical protein ATK36_0464 [Amycolatopsis sulphurea]|uniref:Uncharacterized protein n=1 Tax=Amycolatopsis sulphurea TaxID=76022 RepID=A0A2A9G0I4_9PSEU|nr:hypothetical protein [Amycolatopsis sulphurea]PFG56928.1 hypothetical protein ATK36_0464 [Amycolatopsis sulphurea]
MTRISTDLLLVDRLHDLADLLVGNANRLAANPVVPDVVKHPRVEVYADVATQVRVLADAELARVEGIALVVPVTGAEAGRRVAGRFEALAAVLRANSRTLAGFTADPVMAGRARVYREVATQLRLLAEDERLQHDRPTPPVSAVRVPVPEPSRVALAVAARVPSVRPVFTEPLVAAVTARRRRGWSVARLALWLRTVLRDPQMPGLHPCADRSFVSFLVRLLPGSPVAAAA